VSRRPRETTPGVARWWQADTADLPAVRGLFGELRPEIVFDLASHVAGRRDLELVPETLRANLVGTVNVLVAATEIGARRVVLAGSMEEPDPREGAPVPAFPYAAAKWAASAYARMCHSLYGTPAVITRMAMVYGPHQRDLRKLVPHVTVSLLRGEVPKLSSGERAADWTFGEDCAEGLALAAVVPGADGRTVDLGTGALTSVRDVALQLAAIVGTGLEPAFGALSERPREQQHFADLEGAKEILGWRPRTSLRVGLERTVDWFRAELARGAL
jgi:nucleoside-diphosphate-sugar epimerase